ncbi:hypothetical protein N7468_008610 [Penicillium chermesinum]|uniref:Alpha-1,6-mannosyltransferase subunit n=1 Tax=Penicillium chermesinum TaxID=63820 RepID=A0A9W9NQJ0_9EURO|nr:uncharacterized protein N7468_008610 [Penicillium chermesinum]KAJ5224068.1 hypothetical protein N7468_008610 [Penicillium chermesinum]KAJ6155117.1 hypothetical protein N7470_005683 [Penicillium chermesinum]
MQFALPPRKSPHPLPSVHSSRLPYYRKKQLKTVALFAIAVLVIIFLLPKLFSSSPISSAAPAGTAGVVIVTLLDRDNLSEGYIQKIVSNREDYAKRHGYTNFFANTSDYSDAVGDSPNSWALIPAVRHAMATYPRSAYYFHLSPHALIMNPSKSLKSHILDKSRLESLMLKDLPVVPPDSIIKTFSHLKEKDIDFIATQDSTDISPASFILKNGDFARFFLDFWFEPLFRNYKFVKAEVHGLDHIMQWHPTVLARTALVPQRLLNAYSKDSSGASADGSYKDGDFLIRFPACDSSPAGPPHDCGEMESYYMIWQRKVQNE